MRSAKACQSQTLPGIEAAAACLNCQVLLTSFVTTSPDSLDAPAALPILLYARHSATEKSL